jgi:glutamate racemase
MDNRPIGVFDSGLGGLTVVRELLKRLPNENLIYFGDTGRVPYGSRSPEIIRHFTLQNSRFLLSHGVKCIIAACGTVSSVAGDLLSSLDVPAWGVVEPTADAALNATKNGKIGVLGTAVTVQSRSFEKALQQRRSDVQVFATACPVLVSLVESGWIESDNLATEAVLRQYLQQLMSVMVIQYTLRLIQMIWRITHRILRISVHNVQRVKSLMHLLIASATQSYNKKAEILPFFIILNIYICKYVHIINNKSVNFQEINNYNVEKRLFLCYNYRSKFQGEL